MALTSSLATTPTIIGIGLTTFLLYRFYIAIYRMFFHPLARFPGPRINAMSNLPWIWHHKLQGTLTKDMLQFHQKYGQVVRMAPNQLVVDGALGWNDIFGPRGNRPEFDKTTEFYGVDKRMGIFPSLRDDHRRQRRLLSHAFSTTSLLEQEGHVKNYVDLLMRMLRQEMDHGRVIDIVMWANATTFDIIGELAFADPFGSLAAGKYHPWMAMIFQNIKANSIHMVLNQFSFLRPLMAMVIGRETLRQAAESTELSIEKANKRISRGTDEARKDFMTYVLRHNEDMKGMTHDEMVLNSRSLIIAGSETTATALSGMMFYLTKNPRVYKGLVQEIRASFVREEDITMQSTMRLQYLHAVLEETLRIYPPAPETPPRISPGDYVGGNYVPKGTLVSIFQWATYRLEHNFTNPEDFTPERWLPSTHPLYDMQYASDNKACYKPFSFGPRDCIGKNLAYAEMRLITARFFFNFDVEIEPGQEDWADKQRVFSVYEKSPLMMRLSPAPHREA